MDHTGRRGRPCGREAWVGAPIDLSGLRGTHTALHASQRLPLKSWACERPTGQPWVLGSAEQHAGRLGEWCCHSLFRADLSYQRPMIKSTAEAKTFNIEDPNPAP